MEEKKHQKVMFHLERDENGYPPDDWESLWAYEVGGDLFRIDNIPFFVRGISSEDVVAVERAGDELHFKSLVRPSANSVFRIYASNPTDVQPLRDALGNLQVESELSHIPELVAVEVPGTVAIEPILKLLMTGVNEGRWEIQEGTLRHKV
jgi:Domain of unknown function (DUF4265)